MLYFTRFLRGLLNPPSCREPSYITIAREPLPNAEASPGVRCGWFVLLGEP